jgi:hypothetical protein
VKRSDLGTAEVLSAIRDHGSKAFEHLAATYPAKIVRAAFARDGRTGLLDFGVSLDRPWLSPAALRRMGDTG